MPDATDTVGGSASDDTYSARSANHTDPKGPAIRSPASSGWGCLTRSRSRYKSRTPSSRDHASSHRPQNRRWQTRCCRQTGWLERENAYRSSSCVACAMGWRCSSPHYWIVAGSLVGWIDMLTNPSVSVRERNVRSTFGNVSCRYRYPNEPQIPTSSMTSSPDSSRVSFVARTRLFPSDR